MAITYLLLLPINYYELRLYLEHENSWQCAKKKQIDFVIGIPTEKGDSIFAASATGVELKTSMEDLANSQYGKNFSSFSYNYLLVTENISVRAETYMKKNKRYEHVGILVLCENGELLVIKYAKKVNDSKNFDVTHRAALLEENCEGIDSIKHLFRTNIKLTEEENKQLKADAYAHGMNVSEYVRWLIEKEREKENGKTD